jgi:polyisoprenoid-binding protein YceI
MTARYRLDPGRSRFTVRAFATGPLSFFGHSPTFAVRDFSGLIGFEGGEVKGMTRELTINADSPELQDRVGDADRREIEGRMRREVLETAAFPEITYRSVHVAEEVTSPGRYRLRIDGRLSLHGVTRPHPVVAELGVARLRGRSPAPRRAHPPDVRLPDQAGDRPRRGDQAEG